MSETIRLIDALGGVHTKIAQMAYNVGRGTNTFGRFLDVCGDMKTIIVGLAKGTEVEDKYDVETIKTKAAEELKNAPWDEDGNVQSMVIEALEFWPGPLVRLCFDDVKRARGTEGENDALRVFHRRMEYFLKCSMQISFDTGDEPEAVITAYYEREKLDADGAGFRDKGAPE